GGPNILTHTSLSLSKKLQGIKKHPEITIPGKTKSNNKTGRACKGLTAPLIYWTSNMAPARLLELVCIGILLQAHASDARSRRAVDNCPTPPAPANGTVDCSANDGLALDIYCVFTCNSGYQFQGVTDTEYLFVCDIARGFYDTPSTPPCVPKCDPPCLHGGTCVGPNKCQCVSPYYGDQCLHSRQLCNDPTPGRFGRMECQSDGNGGKICVPVCLPTFKFETPPPAQYVCSKDGTWSPDVTKIPDCIQEIDPPTTTTPKPAPTVSRISSDAVCAAWGKSHFRTFDNKMFSYGGTCRYVLVSVSNSFKVLIAHDPSCASGGECKRQVEIFQGNNKIVLSNDAGGPQLTWNGQVQTLPGFREKSVFDYVGRYVGFRSSLGFEIKWDGALSVFVKVSDDLKGKVQGLCGTYNGNQVDDFELESGQLVSSALDFGNGWKRIEQGDACPDSQTVPGCGSSADAINRIQMADTMCADLLADPAFTPCHSAVDPNLYMDSCRDDCCESGQDSCMCHTMEAYSRACAAKGIKLSWRTPGRCEKSCSGGQVYKECGSTCVRDCTTLNSPCSDTTCVDGCFCPDGQVLNAGQCIPDDQCPCEHSGQSYSQGQTVQEACNTCTCGSGTWTCTTKACDKTCSATGDPHYQTFDGKRYNFMGTCSYYLMRDRDFSIITDNIKCGHGQNSCTKSISIDMNGLNIKMDHNHQLFVNGLEITQLPYEAPGIKVNMVSSLFMQATLSNGVTILWDGRTRAYIKASSAFMGKTIGMCGTFDGNQNNDFKLLNGSVETNPNAFGNHWKTETSCSDMPLETPPDPCEANPQVKAQAIALCDQLKSDIFKDCFGLEDVTPYYDDCVYDLCACADNMKDCMCPNIGSYADTCAAKGISIDWRLRIPECMIQCPPGQEYQVCGRPCERSCRDLSSNTDPACDTKCVEGCNCPAGQTLSDEGICIPFADCPCFFDGREYQPGFSALMGSKICVCEGGLFSCTTIDFRNADSLDNTFEICEDNSVYSTCLSNCRTTCENKLDPPTCSAAGCLPGCECVSGFVFHEDKCVNATMCPCFHGGKAYYEGDSYSQDCNECKCLNHQWQCTQRNCPSTCSAFGESHYTTYDGREFEFQGACDYVLSQSIVGGPHKFVITARNSQCGTSGVTCFKQLEFTVGTEGTADFYRLELIKGQTVIAEPGSPFDVQEIGEMVYVKTPFGVTLQWDKNTRVYIRLATEHMQMVEGLCGNFNRDKTDDLVPREGGAPLTQVSLFGDSWRSDATCAPSQEITDTCVSAPQRKTWAQESCAVLNSDLFAPCHSTVDRAPFLKRCVFDACGCDLGGDCECLCTSLAAYAHECAIRGVPIKWRSNDLCPIECEDCQTYNPCISLCPKKTCENRLYYTQVQKDCEDTQGVCFEGCDLQPCPQGQVYDSLVEPVHCIPEALCETTACEINGKKYREGERVEDPTVCRNDCEMCICRSGSLEHITMGNCDPIPVPTPSGGVRTTDAVQTTRSFNTLPNPGRSRAGRR
ncbi:hypothetical protein EGW08_013514, partial [Elysia chlorotica]